MDIQSNFVFCILQLPIPSCVYLLKVDTNFICQFYRGLWKMFNIKTHSFQPIKFNIIHVEYHEMQKFAILEGQWPTWYYNGYIPYNFNTSFRPSQLMYESREILIIPHVAITFTNDILSLSILIFTLEFTLDWSLYILYGILPVKLITFVTALQSPKLSEAPKQLIWAPNYVTPCWSNFDPLHYKHPAWPQFTTKRSRF